MPAARLLLLLLLSCLLRCTAGGGPASPLASSPAAPPLAGPVTVSRGNWSAAASPSARPPLLSRSRLLSAWAGRCVTFVGDSVSREMHFYLLLYLHGCPGGEWAGLAPAEAASRFPPRRGGLDVAARCAFFEAHMKSRHDRVTRVPTAGGKRRDDLIVRFLWARYLDELPLGGGLSAMLRSDACDLYVLSVGFWPLRLPR